MTIQTAWVKPPAQIGGLDHLAVQAPCINLYGRLLPGITNVTDRARYYSFYPWIVWALEEAGHTYDDEFIDLFRKADCLFTLIAHRHAHVTNDDKDDHAAATIGSANLATQIAKIRKNESIKLSDFAHRKKEQPKYFKNKLGGLGQYYLGVFGGLKIMDGSANSGIRNTNQIGKLLAKAMDISVNRDLFLQTIRADTVTPDRLDQLACFCPCQLAINTREHTLLCDLFFVRELFADINTLPRRQSLQTILYLTDELAKQELAIDLEKFRGCIYSNALPDGMPWEVPEWLQNNRKGWAIYHRNELLSLAIQGIFYVLLDVYQNSGLRFDSTAALCQWFLSTPEVKQLENIFPLDEKVERIILTSSDWLPSLTNWSDENHEVQLAHHISLLCGQENSVTNRSAILQSTLKILVALSVREETKEGYGDIIFPKDYFQYFSLNLNSFLYHTENIWKDFKVLDWISCLASGWGINTHLRVALRKLNGQSQSTFRIRPSDQGLEVISVPDAVFTSPRFQQSLRILKDMRALAKKDHYWVTTDFGKQLMGISDE